jgi:hypothetical protein
MTTPKSAPPAHTNNIELAKFANKTASFITEAMLDFAATDGKTYNKIVLVIVKRDAQNKAEATVRYFLDIAPSKVLFHDLWLGALHNEHSEYKVLHGTQRALNITSLDGGAYRFSVMNKGDGESERMYFDLSKFQTRCLSRSVLDDLHSWQMSQMIAFAIYAHALDHKVVNAQTA